MDAYFNAYKLRYALMDQYMRPIRNSQMIRTANVFINLDDLLHKLHRPLVNKEFQMCSVNAAKQLTANIFNLIGHYKNWCIKAGIRPTVYVIYTTASRTFKNSLYIPNYRSHYFQINAENSGDFYFINQAIVGSRPIIPVFAKYLNGIYAVDSKYIEPSTVPLYLSRIHPADWNLLITRDDYDIQYAYKDHWTVISPKGDQSTVITRKTMWDHIIERERIIVPHSFHFDPSMYVTMKAIAGDKYRSIPKLKRCGWKTIFGYVEEVAKLEDPSPEMAAIQQNRLVEMITKKNLSVDEINRNIYCIDVEKQVNAFLDTDKAIIDACLKDMQDFKALSQYNADVFKEFPLNLQFLCRELVE